MRHGFPFFCQLQAQLPACLRLTVERLRNRRRAAHLTEGQNLHLKVAAVVLHFQKVADADVARRLGWLSVGFDPAEFAFPRGERARLEESGVPQPLLYSYASPHLILLPG